MTTTHQHLDNRTKNVTEAARGLGGGELYLERGKSMREPIVRGVLSCNYEDSDEDINRQQELVNEEIESAGLDTEFDIVVMSHQVANIPILERDWTVPWDAVKQAFDRWDAEQTDED